MLLEKGMLYGKHSSISSYLHAVVAKLNERLDHSFHHHDSQPYWLRTGDTWKNIDYGKEAKVWMEPLVRGETTGMVEIPANWDVSRAFRTQ